MPAGAGRVVWAEGPEASEASEARDVAHRYGVIRALLAAGVDSARVQVFHEAEGGGAYWVVSLDGGRTAVLTDDTEEYVGHLEGPWPFKAVFLGPDGTDRTEIDYSIDVLKGRILKWCTEASDDRSVGDA
ncbi:hypothetical protein OG625_22420 [Streptomyces sp. NBC_01351]|uniref:hypothetical protein n=1 Tax=Streptomyces sp. NBC_01351 TaxID=2903833 RepID=UPI002E332817|nr:hypothetical protein [Streptomyces sp. NBC_01351]